MRGIARPGSRWARRAVALAAASTIAFVGATAEAQYCPCYTASSPNNSHNCAIGAVNGTNPTNAQWAGIFDLVSKGPAAWGTQGPTVSDIGQGCGKPEPSHTVAARFPCELLKAIAKVESGWRQFCIPTTPSDQVGGPSRTIISFDCGYGVGQVTSGMHTGENPSFDRQKVASDPTYNLATGTRILAGKWAATSCVGDNQPTIVEDWYTATWAYNGLAYVNNPNNPNYASDRGVYNPAVNNAAPYEEKVFGWIEHPSNGQWPSVALAYPQLGSIGNSGAPGGLPEPICASPTDCVNHRTVHTPMCIDNPGTGGAGGSGVGGASATAQTGGPSGTTGASGLGAGGSGASGGAGNSNGPDGTGCGCRVAADETEGALALDAMIVLGLAALGRRRSRAG